MSDAPVASVCVATYNRAERLERLLGCLAAQDISSLEVVVYDDASTDRTQAVLASWTDRLRLTALRGDVNRGPAHGRNAAWRAATAPLVLFTDDDCQPTPGWARAHVEAAGPRRITVGATRPDPDQPEGPFSRTLRMSDARHFQTANSGYDRALLVETGGFDERFRSAAGEDTDLGLRAVEVGASALFVPEAEVLHDVRPSSWLAAVRETAKWTDIPLFAVNHPGTLLGVVHSRHWWRSSHPVAVLAVAGLLLSRRQPVAALAAVPWLRLRTTGYAPVRARRRQWPVVLPGQLAVDLAEVAALARGSVRHRRLLL